MFAVLGVVALLVIAVVVTWEIAYGKGYSAGWFHGKSAEHWKNITDVRKVDYLRKKRVGSGPNALGVKRWK